MVAIDEINKLIPESVNNVYVAFSGGVDSHVLLDLTVSIKRLRNKLTALYVHHGIQKQADEWEAHCRQVSRSMNVNFRSVHVDGLKKNKESPEESARKARYQAFKSVLSSDDVILLAQHREDQLETVLIQLFRGAGIAGLSAMPSSIRCGKGLLIRPLLTVSKQSIVDYAASKRLHWIQDPSNLSNDFDRNFLRNQVIPIIKQRWPSVDKTVSRSAGHCASSLQTINEHVEKLFLDCYVPEYKLLNIPRLQSFKTNEINLVIRRWINDFNLPMPNDKFIQQTIKTVIQANPSANPELIYGDYVISRHQDKLCCYLNQKNTLVDQEYIWRNDQSFILLDDKRKLAKVTADAGGILEQTWLESTVTVSYRQGGEKIQLPGRMHHTSLKKLFQERGVPPWQRQSIPLIYFNEELAAVGDQWIADQFYQTSGAKCFKFIIEKI